MDTIKLIAFRDVNMMHWLWMRGAAGLQLRECVLALGSLTNLHINNTDFAHVLPATDIGSLTNLRHLRALCELLELAYLF